MALGRHYGRRCATLANFLRLEVQFGETERFFTLVSGGEGLAFQGGVAVLPTSPGLGLALQEEEARRMPWRALERPWLDPRLG